MNQLPSEMSLRVKGLRYKISFLRYQGFHEAHRSTSKTLLTCHSYEDPVQCHWYIVGPGCRYIYILLYIYCFRMPRRYSLEEDTAISKRSVVAISRRNSEQYKADSMAPDVRTFFPQQIHQKRNSFIEGCTVIPCVFSSSESVFTIKMTCSNLSQTFWSKQGACTCNVLGV